MDRELNDFREKSDGKAYAHFGKRCTLKDDWVWDYVTNPKNIASHKFFPFISFEKDYTKYNNREKKLKDKTRQLCYATHLDRCIYQYYSFLLNGLYNRRVKMDGITNVAVAYRTDLHKNNIHFAKSAFDFIKSHNPCCIMVGDFKSFFDSLDHRYLKDRLCDLLGVNKLSDDWYAVYKSITKYAESRMEDVIKFVGESSSYKDINKLPRLMDMKNFHRFKKYSFQNLRKSDNDNNSFHPAVEKNRKGYGIPQGSSISAIFANVYMLEFDKNIHDYIQRYDGFYMRYCDDFIIIFPEIGKDYFLQRYTAIMKYIEEVKGLILEVNKTQVYEYKNQSIMNCNIYITGEKAVQIKKRIDYLGFSFDGKKISIRDKTLSKYYYRMYRKVKAARYWSIKKKRIQTKSLYNLYSAHRNKNILSMEGCERDKIDKHIRDKGNFLTYVRRSENEFGKKESINQGTHRHMTKIKRAIDNWKNDFTII